MLLALVEDVICQQNRAGQEFYDENKKKDDLVTVTLGPMDIQGKQLNVTRLLKPLNWNWWWLWMTQAFTFWLKGNYRITEQLRLEGILQQSQLEQIAQDCIQLNVEYPRMENP